MDYLVHQNGVGENFTDYPGKSDKYTGNLMWNLSNLEILGAHKKLTKTPQTKNH